MTTNSLRKKTNKQLNEDYWQKEFEKLKKYCNNIGYEVVIKSEKDYGYVDLDNKEICVNYRTNAQRKVYVLLHELGHIMINENKQSFTANLGYVGRTFQKKSLTAKVCELEEEYEAWKIGYKIGRHRKIKIDRREFESYKAHCLYFYIKNCTELQTKSLERKKKYTKKMIKKAKISSPAMTKSASAKTKIVNLKTATNDELFLDYFENEKNNVSVRNELATRNQPLVSYILNKYYSGTKLSYDSKQELLQEGYIGLMSAIEGFNPNYGYKFSTYACVPLTTQILTRTGWKRYDELQDGDETIGYNNGKSEWTKIRGVATYQNAPLMKFGDSLWYAKCTPQHKWIVSENNKTKLLPLNKWPGPKNYEWPSKRLNYKRKNTHLVTSAPFVGGNSELTNDEAALLAWILSDGSLVGGRQNPTGAVIIQKATKFADNIRNLLKRLHAYNSDVKHGDSGCLSFTVKAPVFRRIWKKSGLQNRTVLDLVFDLKPKAREAWFEAWYQAEGTLGRNSITQNKGEKLDALAVCAFLQGHNDVRIAPKSERCFLVTWHNKPRTPRRCISEKIGEEGPVWCPKTDLGSWTAKTEDGFVFLTGNTWWIKQAINNYLININPIIRVPNHVKAAQYKLMKQLKIENKSMVDIDSINPEDYDISPKMLNSINSAFKSKMVESFQSPAGSSEDSLSLEERISETNFADVEYSDYSKTDVGIDTEFLVDAFKEALKSMPEKRRMILLLRFDVLSEKDVLLLQTKEQGAKQ